MDLIRKLLYLLLTLFKTLLKLFMNANDKYQRNEGDLVELPPHIEERDKIVRYPRDPTRLVYKNQLIVRFAAENDVARGLKDIFFLTGEDANGRAVRHQVRVLERCHCNKNLLLVEGIDTENVHLLSEKLAAQLGEEVAPIQIEEFNANDIEYSPDRDVPPPNPNPALAGAPEGPGAPDPPQEHNIDDLMRPLEGKSYPNGKRKVVAIMDTGIHLGYPNTANLPNLINQDVPFCNTDQIDVIGWDFVNDQPDPFDDNLNRHGSRIAAIINRIAPDMVQFLHLKVFKANGIGNLFDLCCGFEYILRKRTAVEIINASWGFYRKGKSPLFTFYMNELIGKGIWFINAAGNEGDRYKNRFIELKDPDLRWPACYSKDLETLVTVTTVRNNQARKEVAENYSSSFVDVGIGAGPDAAFEEPLINDAKLPSVKGSSYATAFVSGLIARYLFEHGLAPKDVVLEGIGAQRKNDLQNHIREGFYIEQEDGHPQGPV
ncbi:hypothetical protein GCM10023189_10670 [Nibrella saemangeumensis]|uniref:Peptidase S8/S53 domain-containing protein n=1 Tax=Nibrella saemangeumensis TaxID=1084526 RepID=A0ABP8MGQ0_9BACT